MPADIRVSSFQKGDHICFFYRSLEEQMATAAPFVLTGLQRGERCLCVLPQAQTERLLGWLDNSGFNPQKEIARRALVMRTPQEAYLAAGSFNGNLMMKLLDEGMRQAVAEGFSGFRGTGDLSWAARDACVCGYLPEYERMLDEYFPGKPFVGICMYDARSFEEASLRRILDAHRLALITPDEKKRAIRIRNGRAFGDVTFDRNSPYLFHYTVQREGKSEYLYMGQEPTLL